jgi:ceramide glucosyltransferase
MRLAFHKALRAATLGAALGSLAYAAFAVVRLRTFARRTAPPPSSSSPSVTVLKPVRGLEPLLDRNLRSFCDQRYANFQVVFGVADAEDPALPLLRAIVSDHPDRAELVIGDGRARFRNPKIANLAPMLERARGEILVIADSDMHVARGYLDAIVAAFAPANAGAVTALYRGEPADERLPSVIGAMGITEAFVPSALVAGALQSMAHTFGSTMAVRRDVLRRIGSLAALGDSLADDHRLGQLVREYGYSVELAHGVVANTVSERDVGELFRHEVRWARTIRTVRPTSYLGILLTFPLPLASLHFALAPRSPGACVLLSLAIGVRGLLHSTAHRALESERVPSPWLIPLRDALGVAVWIAGLSGSAVRWRDADLAVNQRGEIGA